MSPFEGVRPALPRLIRGATRLTSLDEVTGPPGTICRLEEGSDGRCNRRCTEGRAKMGPSDSAMEVEVLPVSYKRARRTEFGEGPPAQDRRRDGSRSTRGA